MSGDRVPDVVGADPEFGPFIVGGIGHNLPQEAPGAFVDAIVEADGLAA